MMTDGRRRKFSQMHASTRASVRQPQHRNVVIVVAAATPHTAAIGGWRASRCSKRYTISLSPWGLHQKEHQEPGLLTNPQSLPWIACSHCARWLQRPSQRHRRSGRHREGVWKNELWSIATEQTRLEWVALQAPATTHHRNNAEGGSGHKNQG